MGYVSSFHVVSFNDFWKFLCLGNSAWDFFGVKFLVEGFFGGMDGSPRVAPNRSSLSLEIWSTPWGLACTKTLFYFSFRSFGKHRRARERDEHLSL